MKVAYIAPYSQGTGYSHAAIDGILALDSVGVDVVCRNIPMTASKGEVPQRIFDLEKKDLLNVDVIFQQNLPSEFLYKGGVVNIGSYFYETSGFPNSNWNHNLSLMDGIVVFCNQQKDVLLKTFGQQKNDKIKVLPQALDVTKFDKEYTKFDFDLPKNCTKFYTISELSKRKNINGLLYAYLSEFSVDDNVCLVIKTHLPNRDGNSTKEFLKATIDDIKNGLKRFAKPEMYPKIILLTEYLTEDEICGLHQSCDVFVSASYGESFCIPAVESMGFGHPVIAPNSTAFQDYVDPANHNTLVDVAESPVLGVLDSPNGLYTGDECWKNPIGNLSWAMRYHTTTREIDLKFSEDRKSYVKNTFNYNKVGLELKGFFEGFLAGKGNELVTT